ncbi:PQQ-dependent sugar dehydrogenase [Altererythrobacter aestuarii]|uniref:PQQ-dependent sugar dehydrogenase n=2 Tax=Alteraurantiacibacter aestuarii TaxID=650004 RepID=A0A844ZP80_9SPHN|nr:PQQ-dependent sugar dehydrogenase [Alteraurantiacibacter aestuarii]MXO88820.1 PQQ-dependent sugar dehydrogenase [Alteraurantiacibacter aestuarii]
MAAAFFATGAYAQQDVPMTETRIPVAPTGLADNPLPDGPFHYRTAEGMDIRVEVLARLEYPMSMAFLPDGDMLVVTRRGELHMLEQGASETSLIEGGPEGVFFGESGDAGTSHAYVDIVLHPDFAANHFIYLAYNKPTEDGSRVMALGRGRWTGDRLEGFEDIWVAHPGVSGVSRMAFANDGKLIFTTSGSGPQNLSTAGGKVLRINDDGSIPDDNPFIGDANARDDVYSYGHRGSLGLAIHPTTGAIWQNENGPNGGDEINIIKPGANYGWPYVSLGRTYQGPWQAERPRHDLFEPPVVYWMPAIAPSGMLFYTGDALPAWKGDIFVGALRTGEIPGTGHLERILINQNMQELRRETLLYDLRQRVRDVRQGPDGYIYLATEERDGAILRIVPDD